MPERNAEPPCDPAEQLQPALAFAATDRRFQALIEHSWDAIVLLGAEGVILYVSPATPRMLGWATEEMVGRHVFELMHPDDVPPAAALLAQILETPGARATTELRYQHRDGSWRWVEATGANLLHEPSVQAVVGNFRDITERRQAEAAHHEREDRIRQQRERLEEAQRFLVEASGVLASSLDYATTLTHVARLAVPRLADWCTVDIAAADGSLSRLAVAHVDPSKVALARELQERYPPDPEAPRGPAHVVRTGQVDHLFEIPEEMWAVVSGDPDYLRILRDLGLKSYLCVPLPARGRTLGAITFVMAESGRRYGPGDLALVEDLGRRAAIAIDNARLYHQVEAAARRKDEYLTMLAHELRNPLAPILNAVELLQRKLLRIPGCVSENDEITGTQYGIRHTLAIIDRQVRHQARLIDDLLDVTRINHGKIVLRREPLDLARLVRDSVADHCSALEQAGLALTLDVPGEPVWVDGDPTRLAQILDNLLTNALKFTHAGGKVGVQVFRCSGVQVFRPAKSDPSDPSDASDPNTHHLNTRTLEHLNTRTLEHLNTWAVITVRDTGIGIEAELLPHVFESFMQADRSLERSRGGLGLGLALVKGLVELHGGQVHAESEGPGCGATFMVRLPLSPASAAAEPAPAPAGMPGHPLRVLIVEDNRDAAESLRDLLELSGRTVAVAYSGPEALDVAGDFRPEVVLCDLGLPGMDGYQVARALRQDPATAAVRLIVVSGYGEAEDQRRSREAGFDLHLTKPVDFAELERAMEGHIGTRNEE